MLRLTIFGLFSLADSNGTEIELKSRKAKALLAYLAISDRMSRSREEIMALLWSDRADTQARGSLRQVLTGLRKALGESGAGLLNTGADSISLNPDKIAVSEATGEEFLAGLHIADPAFDDWLRDERSATQDAFSSSRETTDNSQQGRPTIAVLPFANLSKVPEQEYFADGITEDIITELSRFSDFLVAGKSSTFQYKEKPPTAKDLLRDLNVRYALQGSVRRSGDRVRVTAHLIETSGGVQIWSERFDRDFGDIFAIQDEITVAIVAQIEDRVKDAVTTDLRRRRTPNMSAYDLVLQARPYRTQIDPTSSAKAANLLENAIATDPGCSSAYAALAFVKAGEYEEGWTSKPEDTMQTATLMAENAVRLDPSDGYAHASLAYACNIRGDFERAMHEASVALDLNPNHVNIIMTKAWISITYGNPELGIQLIEHARRLNPNLPGFELWTLGEALLDARRYEDAVKALQKVNDPPAAALLEMAIAYAYLGETEKAQAYTREYLDRSMRDVENFPGTEPLLWRKFFEQTLKRRHQEDFEHFVLGARKAGLPI